jgi:DNA ligase-associated metallophosphoesterase
MRDGSIKEGSRFKLNEIANLSGALAIEFAQETLHLLPQRAVWWPARRTLLLADVHFGKSAAFRQYGVPVPSGSTARDLSRISDLVNATGAERLIILGDLVHGPVAKLAELIEAVAIWRERNGKLKILLVRGNHDRAAGPVAPQWKIDEVAEPYEEDGFRFCHAPCDDRDLPTFAGHVHPTAQLRDFDGSVVIAPCFVVENQCLILPSFGTFTGGYTVEQGDGREIFIVSPTRVVKHARSPSERS